MRLKAELRERVEAARTPDGRFPFLVNDMVIEEQLCQMRCSYCLTEEYNLLMNVPDARLRLTTDRRTDWLDILDRYHRTVDSPILRLSGGEFFWLRGSTEFVQEASARYEKSMADAKVRHKAEASVSNPLAIDREEGPEGTVTNL